MPRYDKTARMSAERSALAPGTVVAGKLRVIRSLGVGGMGAVYEVEHQLTHHRRALKLLHPEVARESEAVTRFLREASAAGRIGSDHIVQTFDAGVLDSGAPYLVMEMLEGKSLGDILSERGTLTEREARDWVAQACDGLQAAHDAGIVHRDIKPDNLFVLRSGRIKILDFGISKFDSALTGEMQLTRDNLAMGTPYYMAPEQTTAANRVDARVDVYALGVVLYEAVTGQKPFVADTFPQLIIRIHQGNYSPASSVSATSLLLDRIIAKAMARDPDARFSTPRALALALRDLDQPTERIPEAQPADLTRGGAGREPLVDPHSPTVRIVDAASPRVSSSPPPSPNASAGVGAPPRSVGPTLLSAGSEQPGPIAEPAAPAQPRKRPGWGVGMLVSVVLVGSGSLGAWRLTRQRETPIATAQPAATREPAEALSQAQSVVTPAAVLPALASAASALPAADAARPASSAPARIPAHSPVISDKSSRAAKHQLEQSNPFQ